MQNAEELRLDARRVVNKLLYHRSSENDRCEEENVISDPQILDTVPPDESRDISEIFRLPSKLHQPSYFLSPAQNPDPEINLAINHLNNTIVASNFSKRASSSGNLSRAEKLGLKWLEEKVANDEIDICQADKGGAILIVPPDYLSKKVGRKAEQC